MVDNIQVVDLPKNVSPKYSMKGWDISTAFSKNLKEIKALFALLTSLSVLNTFQGFNWRLFLIQFVLAVLALAVKIGSDAVHYYFKEVDLDQ